MGDRSRTTSIEVAKEIDMRTERLHSGDFSGGSLDQSRGQSHPNREYLAINLNLNP